MTRTVRARYTLAFKQEAVRLVRAGQSIAAASLRAARFTSSVTTSAATRLNLCEPF